MSLHLLDTLGLFEFLDATDWSDEALHRRRQTIVRWFSDDPAQAELEIEPLVGVLLVQRVCFCGGRFDRDIEGFEAEPAVIVGDLDEFENITDLIAWPVDAPQRMASLLGRSPMLGLTQALRHPATAFSAPLPVFRTAAGWLRNRCVGCAPVDRLGAARAFLEIGGEILAEDDAHGAELAAARQELVSRSPAIVVAEMRRAA